MIELYNSAHVHVASLEKVNGQHVRRTLSDGDESLEFSYPRKAASEAEIKTEGYVRTERQEYVIKSVDRKTRATMTSVAAALNIEALEGTVFLNGFETVEKTIQECMELALADTGWRCSVAADITKRRTIRAEDDTTAWEIIKDVVSTYKVEIRIETLEKCLYFSTKRGQDKGVYFYERLNLRSLGVKESSYGFFTKIIPIGKNGLHLWVGEKDYIENHQYSPKTITAIWRDERYTNTTSLYNDAVARLEEASRPVMAYTGDVVDLAKQSEKYAVLDYDLGDTVILASESIGVWIKQRIVQLDEYAGHPEKNKAEFSNVPQTFAQLQKSGDDLAKKEAIRVASKTIREQLTNTYYTREEVETAIRAMSDAIELEVSKSYVTKGEGEEYAAAAKKAAEEAGKAAEAAANEHTDSVLLAYSTTEEMDAAIKVATDAINLSVSEKYATTELVEEKVGEVQGKADQAAADAAAAQGTADQAKADADVAAKKAAAAKTAADKAAEDAAAAEENAAADAEAKAEAAKQAAIEAAAAQSAADAATAEAAAKEAAAKDATQKAKSAAADAKNYTDGRLVSYTTKAEMRSAIEMTTQEIDLSVSSKVEEKAVTKEELAAKLQIMSNEISMNFTSTKTEIQGVNGDMENRFEQLRKYMKFSGETALTLGTGEGALTLELDPEDGIIFSKNGVPFGRWDGVDFHTGNIIIDVNEKAQLGIFAYIPRSDGSLMFLKVSGNNVGEEDEEYEEFVPTPGRNNEAENG